MNAWQVVCASETHLCMQNMPIHPCICRCALSIPPCIMCTSVYNCLTKPIQVLEPLRSIFWQKSHAEIPNWRPSPTDASSTQRSPGMKKIHNRIFRWFHDEGAMLQRAYAGSFQEWFSPSLDHGPKGAQQLRKYLAKKGTWGVSYTSKPTETTHPKPTCNQCQGVLPSYLHCLPLSHGTWHPFSLEFNDGGIFHHSSTQKCLSSPATFSLLLEFFRHFAAF